MEITSFQVSNTRHDKVVQKSRRKDLLITAVVVGLPLVVVFIEVCQVLLT